MKRSFITKTELAQAYFPYINERAARHKLMSLINDSSLLISKLREVGYRETKHLLSPVQVDLIMETFGNPFK